MDRLRFEWDEAKNKANQRKHGVSFEEVRTAFHDENAREYLDPDHSDDQDHFILLGMSFKLRAVVVFHCFRERDLVVWIISARKADKVEEQAYWESVQ